ncbi:MAG: CsiV family protein [Acidiferrobacterales bacterium]
MKYLPLLFASLFFSSSVIAVSDKPNTPIYEVEILVFKNMQIEDQGTELWLQDIDPNNQPDVANASPVGGGIPAESTIKKISDKLVASGYYTIISHKRWIQDAIPKTEAKLIRIANSEENLDGTLLFYKGRFLHLGMNLILTEELMPVGNTGDNRDLNGNATSGNIVNSFVIKEDRRIRSVALNYFDHPRFGVIVQVNQVNTSKQ